ncbi:MAG: hypothetical protein NZ699_02820 [Roseiflexus sp.]|nr:hypothetical protein [Roseiflexus sp.]MCS7288046.1 hypothetical protein [Roseiflexus sp.]MDW8233737.1 hypothetical protein [Roseiflexaceae bacterium]
MASNHRPGWLDRLLRIERSESRDTIEADVVELSNVSAGAVEAQKATLSRAFARSVTAQDDVSMTFSAALAVQAGGDVNMTGSAATALIAGRDVRLNGASAGFVAAREARMESGRVGVLLAGSAELGNQTHVLITGRNALLLGAAFGIFFPLVAYLLRRFAPPQEQTPRPWYARAGRWALRQTMVLGGVGLLGWVAYRSLRQRVMRLLPGLAGR